MTISFQQIEVLTLFVDDIAASRAFYTKIFGCQTVYEDDVSFVLQFEDLMVNFLHLDEAYQLVEQKMASLPTTTSQLMMTIRVRDADAICATLREAGVELLNGPVDRPWGRRTAAFADPSGHVWEIAEIIPEQTGAA